MKKIMLPVVWAAACALFASVNPAFAQGTAFTYQGSLHAGGAAANGNFDFQFSLYNAATNGAQIGPVLTNADVGVSNGLFTVTLDFGGVFGGNPLWLEIGVRTNGSSGAFTPLSPLQALTPVPYAEYAPNADTASTVPGGAISAAQLNTTGGAPTSGEVLTFNGSGLEWTNPAASSGGWSLTGNSGTSPSTDFLGTTDSAPLVLRANNVEVLYLQGNANGSVNIQGGYTGVGIGAYGVMDFGGGQGGFNTVYPNFGTISGGFDNSIYPGAIYSTIPGGYGNFVGSSAAYSFAAGSQA